MIPILMYHQIGLPAPRGTPYRSLVVHPHNFRRQMAWLRRLGYQGMSMRDLLPYLSGEKTGRVVGITFDDGYCNVLENALPVLKANGFTATNYFVAGQLAGSNVWDHAQGIPPSPLMTPDQIRAWSAAGMEVGSHTVDHLDLPNVSLEIARDQIVRSRQVLEGIVQKPVTAFCYPYGHETPPLRQLVWQAGYSNATTTEGGLVRPDDDPFGLPRVLVARTTHIVRFLQKCLTHLEDRKRRAKGNA